MSKRFLLLVSVVVSTVSFACASHVAKNSRNLRCKDDFGNPQRCVPDFQNVAFKKRVEVSNTCGEDAPVKYCLLAESTRLGLKCNICDSSNAATAHSPQYLTDWDKNENYTFWQSETMHEGIQWPNSVNLTLHLQKAHDITYILLKFHSARPESFVIYKRSREDGPWIPFQYFSATCRDTYGLHDLAYAQEGEVEPKALCTSEFSDISPLKGGRVVFSTLEGRPDAYNFDNSKVLQDWVTATDIMLSFHRLHTFGDEVSGDENVLRSYFYALSDFSVGGSCKCNGHASECVERPTQNLQTRLVCRCEHNTDGPDCDICKPCFNDQPWARAKSGNAHECKPCNCNNFSDHCFFNSTLYEETGHGGHCVDCRGNRDGPNCERCKTNFYLHEEGHCSPCNCDAKGSQSLQCNVDGKCECTPGVTGEKCDGLQDYLPEFGKQGYSSAEKIEPGHSYNIFLQGVRRGKQFLDKLLAGYLKFF